LKKSSLKKNQKTYFSKWSKNHMKSFQKMTFEKIENFEIFEFSKKSIFLRINYVNFFISDFFISDFFQLGRFFSNRPNFFGS